jgi:hypothetical protein
MVVAGLLAALGLVLLCGAAFLTAPPAAVRVLFGIGGLALIVFAASKAMNDKKTGLEATGDGVKVISESLIGYTETETIEKTGLNPEGRSPIPDEGPGSPPPKSPADL